MDVIPTTGPVDVDAQLDEIARRYKRAGGLGVDLLNLVGGKAEGLLHQLPGTVRAGLEQATQRALEHAMRVAHDSRAVPSPPASGLAPMTSSEENVPSRSPGIRQSQTMRAAGDCLSALTRKTT